MKTLLTLPFLILLLCGCQGCKTSPETTAFRAAATIETTVDGAMKGWGDWVRAGKATDAQQAQVKAAYQQYQLVVATARDFIKSYSTGTDPNGFNKAFDALNAAQKNLLDLIVLFTKK